jgi:Transglycosylase SLT domain
MPRPSFRSAAIGSSGTGVFSLFPAIIAQPDRCSGTHYSRRFRSHACAAVVVVLLVTSGTANAQLSAAAQSAVAPKSDPFGPFVAEAARRFGIPASWIRAVMQTESQGTVRAVSPKGAMGLMQIMPQTWADLRSRYGLGADPFDPHDNILAGAAYLRELRDRYGVTGVLSAYNAGPERYDEHLASGRPLPAETQAYVAVLAPMLPDDGSPSGNLATAMIRSWSGSSLFPVRPNDGSSTGAASSGDLGQRPSTARTAMDRTGLAPQPVGLFAALSAREPRQ